MKKLIENIIKINILALILTIGTLHGIAQESNKDYENAKSEITETFGTFPQIFDAFPEYALPGAWQAFKDLDKPANINAKNRELIGVAVASQIPCNYCVYYHTILAKANGATDEEIREAVAIAGNVRNWSTIANGALIDFDEFKKEFDKMVEYMAKKAEAK